MTPVGEQLHRRLDRFVRHRVSNPSDAEDVLQDVLLNVLSKPGPEEANKLLPWVFAIARNRVVDFYRKQGRSPAEENVFEETLPSPPSDEAPRILQSLESSLDEFINQLSEEDQHALRTVDLGGMSQKEYALSLGLGYTTAKSRVQRARKRLRAAFEDCCRFELDRRGRPISCEPHQEDDSCEAC